MRETQKVCACVGACVGACVVSCVVACVWVYVFLCVCRWVRGCKCGFVCLLFVCVGT